MGDKVTPRDEAESEGGGGVVVPEGAGDESPESESATTLMASFWPPAQCPENVHIK